MSARNCIDSSLISYQSLAHKMERRDLAHKASPFLFAAKKPLGNEIMTVPAVPPPPDLVWKGQLPVCYRVTCLPHHDLPAATPAAKVVERQPWHPVLFPAYRCPSRERGEDGSHEWTTRLGDSRKDPVRRTLLTVYTTYATRVQHASARMAVVIVGQALCVNCKKNATALPTCEPHLSPADLGDTP